MILAGNFGDVYAVSTYSRSIILALNCLKCCKFTEISSLLNSVDDDDEVIAAGIGC